MAVSIWLMFCSYTSINVRVKYQTLEANRRAEEQMKDICTFSLNIILKINSRSKINCNLPFLQCIGGFISFVYSVSADR